MESNNSESAIFNNYSDGNLTLLDIDRYRQHLSDEMAMVLLPAIVVLGIVLFIGAVGNTLVFYIYLSKFNSSSTRTAIIALACFDLLSCILCIPGEILDLRFSYSFTSQILCKSFRTLTTIALIASGFTLLSVALDRYQRICHPLHHQLTSKQAVKRVAISCTLAMLLAVPAAVVYGITSVQTPRDGVYGMECSTSQSFKNHPLRIAYNALLCILFLAAFATMIIIYIFIGRQVVKQTHFRNSVQKRKGSNGSLRRHTVCSENSSDGDHSYSDRLKDLPVLPETIHEDDSPSNLDTSLHPATHPTCFIDTRLTRKNSMMSRIRNMSHSLDARTRKTTSMLFFITLVFVVSFLPHLILKVIQSFNKNFVDNLSTYGVIIYNIFVRSYFFNTAANAFVYGFCSPKFRHECRTMFSNLAFWLKNQKFSTHAEDLM